MGYEQREGDIAVFRNDNKTNERAPDWKGTAVINGQKMAVAFWEKNSRMLAGTIKIDTYVKGEGAAKPETVASSKASDDIDEDQIPF
jgi:hypothetical protein